MREDALRHTGKAARLLIEFAPLRLVAVTLIAILIFVHLPQTLAVESGAENTNSFFGKRGLPKLAIEISQENMAALRQHPRRDVRVNISEDGTVYRDVALHLKGSTGSFRTIDEKPSFTLDFKRFEGKQRFHGLGKIHLNNSVEDPAYVNEQLGSELFQSAGMPAPRVMRALVAVNGKRPAFYVLKEAFDEDFLRSHFQSTNGVLYEPIGGGDIDSPMKRRAGRAAPSDALNPLRAALAQTEPKRQSQLFPEALDLDQFITFMVLEVMICHRDGYCLARNNYRVFWNSVNEKVQFIPQGMDQLFGSADIPWNPQFGGLVARVVMSNQETRKAYGERFDQLFPKIFKVQTLTNRVHELVEQLRPEAEASEFNAIQDEGREVCARIAARFESLRTQLEQKEMPLLVFNQNAARICGWHPVDKTAGIAMNEILAPEGNSLLHIAAAASNTSSWRTSVRLKKGVYRFEGMVKISQIAAKPFGRNQGAGLRVIGRAGPPYRFIGTSEWKNLHSEFEIGADCEEIELACELTANSGDAWFDERSLQIKKLR